MKKEMINYNIIDKSISFYDARNYKRIESPWTVSEQIDSITRPKDRIAFQLKHNDKCLVGSGEQSFLYLYLKGFLPKGLFQTVTPCFRYENFDLFHTKYFIKNELINTVTPTELSLDEMVSDALSFHKKYLPKSEVIKTKIGFDIVCDGIELGSYGIRECEFLKWVYGTGCAEPRISSTIDYLKRKNGSVINTYKDIDLDCLKCETNFTELPLYSIIIYNKQLYVYLGKGEIPNQIALGYVCSYCEDDRGVTYVNIEDCKLLDLEHLMTNNSEDYYIINSYREKVLK